jgi:hypothetical protein
MIIILLPNYKIYFFVIKLSNELLINFTKAWDVRKQHKKIGISEWKWDAENDNDIYWNEEVYIRYN